MGGVKKFSVSTKKLQCFTGRLTCSKSCARATQPYSWKTARLVVQGLHLHPRSDALSVESMSASTAWLRCGPTSTTTTHTIQGTTLASLPAGGTYALTARKPLLRPRQQRTKALTHVRTSSHSALSPFHMTRLQTHAQNSLLPQRRVLLVGSCPLAPSSSLLQCPQWGRGWRA